MEASGVYTIKSRSRAANHSKGTKVGAKGEHYRVTQEELRSFQYLPQTIKDFNQRTASNNKGEGYNATEEEPRKQAYSIYVLQTIKKPSKELQPQQKDKSYAGRAKKESSLQVIFTTYKYLYKL